MAKSTVVFVFTKFVLMLVQFLVFILLQSVAAQIHTDSDHNSHSCDGYFARYGEWCSPDGHRCCSSTEHLTCNSNQCECKPDYVYIDRWGVRACQVDPSANNGWSCTFDEQCQLTIMGKYSRCEFRKCRCHDVYGQNRATVMEANVCRLLKNVGDSCESDDECNWTIAGEARCVGIGGSSAVGVCECADGYIFDKNVANECLQLKSVNQTCQYNIQCTKSLGELSSCSSEGPAGKNWLGIRRAVCQCSDTKNPPYAALKTKWYKPNPNPLHLRGRCYYVKVANETCAATEECMLGYQNPRAACAPHDSYNGEHVCQCPVGQDCRPDYSNWNGTRRSSILCWPGSLTLLIAFLCARKLLK